MDISFDQSSTSLGPSSQSWQRPQHPTTPFTNNNNNNNSSSASHYVPAHSRTTSASKFSYRNVGENIDDRLILHDHNNNNNSMNLLSSKSSAGGGTADSIGRSPASERRRNDNKPPTAGKDRNNSTATQQQHQILSNSSIISNSSTVIVHGSNETPPPETPTNDNEDKNNESFNVDHRKPYYGTSPRHPHHSSQQRGGGGGGASRGGGHEHNDDKPAVSNTSLSSASFLARILSGGGGEGGEREQKKHETSSSVSTNTKLFGLGATPSPRPTRIHHTRVPSLLIEAPPLYAEEEENRKKNRGSPHGGYEERNDEEGDPSVSGGVSGGGSGGKRWNEGESAHQQHNQRYQPKAKTSISAAAAALTGGRRDNFITDTNSNVSNDAKGTNSNYESASFQPHSSVYHTPPQPRATASSYASHAMLAAPSFLRPQPYFENSAANANSPTPLTDQISRRFYYSPPPLPHPEDRRSGVTTESARRGLGLVRSPSHSHHHADGGSSSFGPQNGFALRSSGAFYSSPTKIEGFSVDRETTAARIGSNRNQSPLDDMFNQNTKKSPIMNLQYAPAPALTQPPASPSQLRTHTRAVPRDDFGLDRASVRDRRERDILHDNYPYYEQQQQYVGELLPPKDESAIDEDEEDYQKSIHDHVHFSEIPERFTGNFADVSLGLRAATSPFVGDEEINNSLLSASGGGRGEYRRDLKMPVGIGSPKVYSRSQYGKRRYVPSSRDNYNQQYSPQHRHHHQASSSSHFFSPPPPTALVEEVIGGPFFDTEHHQNQKQDRRISMDSLLTIAGLLESQGLNPMADDANYQIAMHHRKEDNLLFALENALLGDYVTRYHPLKRSGGKNGVGRGTAASSLGVFFGKNGSIVNQDPVERFIQIKLEEPSGSYRRNVCADREFPIPYLIVKVAESDSAEVISRYRLSNLVGVTRDVSHPSFGPHRVFRDGSVGFQGVLFEDEPMCPDPDRCTEESQHFYKLRQLALLAALSDKVVGIHGKRLVSATTGSAATSISPVTGAPHRLLHADNAFVLWFLDCNTLEADQLILCAHTAQSAGFWVNVMKSIVAVNSSRKLPVPAETPFNFGGAIGLGASELSVYQAIQNRGKGGGSQQIEQQSNNPSSVSPFVRRRGEQQEVNNNNMRNNVNFPEGLNESRRQPRPQQQQQEQPAQADMTVMMNETLAREGTDGNDNSSPPLVRRPPAEANVTTPHSGTDDEFSGPTRSPANQPKRLSSIRNKNEEKFASRYYIPKEVYVDPATGEPVAEDGLTRSERLHIRRQRPPMAYLFRKARYLIDVKNNDSRFFE